ncbi:MAG TPA: GNAT family N-acetyltransferase [Longimicrobium sp.]|jgi:GNAT superfamily N-acetyltransferase|uniref:GNAT family N-acetyltransferase n=1 Tax=Longimicrobium sp. TaxID=2029185 RepID=UPI002ED9084C
MNPPYIRAAQPADAEALAELGARTFSDAFAADNRPEDMAAYMAQAYTPEQMAAELADPWIVTVVAESEGKLVAYAQVGRGSAPPCVTGDPVELRRFYLDRAWQGSGLAAPLMAEAVRAASFLGGTTFWLGVWERNPRAIRFYTKHGFVDVGSHVFQLGSDAQTDRIMSRPLPAA